LEGVVKGGGIFGAGGKLFIEPNLNKGGSKLMFTPPHLNYGRLQSFTSRFFNCLEQKATRYQHCPDCAAHLNDHRNTDHFE
jgi:hypothetical protein